MDGFRDASTDLLFELARPSRHDTVLDYACGVGVGALALASNVRLVEAVDDLPDSIDEARQLARMTETRWLLEGTLEEALSFLASGLKLRRGDNVLIYFDEKMKKKVIDHMYECLKPKGYLTIGHAESLHNISRAFKPLVFPGTIAYQKG